MHSLYFVMPYLKTSQNGGVMKSYDTANQTQDFGISVITTISNNTRIIANNKERQLFVYIYERDMHRLVHFYIVHTIAID